MITGPVPEWQPKPVEPAPVKKPAATAKKGTTSARKAPAAAAKKAPVEIPIPIAIAPRVRSVQITEKAWYAATNEGLFISVDEGKKWYGTPVEGETDFVAANDYPDGTLTLATLKRTFLSRDGGRTWAEVTIPRYVTGVYNFTMTPDSMLWLGTAEGAVQSADGGKTWIHVLSGMPTKHVLGVKYDPTLKRLLATAIDSHQVYESTDDGKTWRKSPESTFSIRQALGYQDQMLAVSWHNGLLLQNGASGKAGAVAEITGTAKSQQ
jgi:photosystem II stability/assembly factor-like uncharacterized protein